MRLKYTSYLAFLFFGLMACNNDSNNTTSTINNSSSSKSDADLLKEKTFCYNLYNYDIQELLTIVDNGSDFSGEIRGIINGQNIAINGALSAKCQGDTCEVAVIRDYGDMHPRQTTNELWVRNKKGEFDIIKGLTYPHMTASTFTFRPIRCFQFDPKAKFDGILEFKDGFAPVIQNNLMGIIDSNYNIIVPIEYEYISHISEKTISFHPQGSMMMFYGIMDLKGNIITEANKTYATPFYEGLAAVLDDDGFYFIDKEGKVAIKPNNYRALLSALEYESQTSFIKEGLIPIQKNEKWGCLDKKGNIVIPFEYDYIEHFKNGIAMAQKAGKTISIDRNNKCVSNCN